MHHFPEMIKKYHITIEGAIMRIKFSFLKCILLIPALSGCTSSDVPLELVQPENWWENLPRPIYASLEKMGTYQGWFEVYKLSEGTYAIYEPFQFEEAISYLVLGENRGIIIDTGTGIGNIRAVVDQLTDLPVSVVNTHTHYDHVGGNFRFDEIAVYGDSRALDRLNEGVDNARLQRLITEESIWKPLPGGFDPDTWIIPSTQPAYLLDNGTLIDLGKRTLEVIYTPGHSSGSICLLDRDNRLLFTGDTFYPGPLYAHTDDADIDKIRSTFQMLSDRIIEFDYLLTGHNEPWVESEVIPRVSEAFDAIVSGEGRFDENEGLRRYYFDGFDVLIRSEMIK